MNEAQKQYIEQLKAQQNLKSAPPINMPDERAKPVEGALNFALGVQPPNPNDPQALQGMAPELEFLGGLQALGGLTAARYGTKAVKAIEKAKRAENIRDLVRPYPSMAARREGLKYESLRTPMGLDVIDEGISPVQERVFNRLMTNPAITSRTTPRGANIIMQNEIKKLGRIQMDQLKKYNKVKVGTDEVMMNIEKRMAMAFDDNPVLGAGFDDNMRQFQQVMNGINKDIAKMNVNGQLTPVQIEQIRRNLDRNLTSMKGAKFTDGDGNATPLYVIWREVRSSLNDLVDKRVADQLFNERRKAMNDYFDGIELTQGRAIRTGRTPMQRRAQNKKSKEPSKAVQIMGRFRSMGY